jgi:hypothetical protein
MRLLSFRGSVEVWDLGQRPENQSLMQLIDHSISKNILLSSCHHHLA